MTVHIEGNIGSGKTSLLKYLQKCKPLLNIVPEPVDEWTNFHGTDLLALFYTNPKKWAMTFQMYVMLTIARANSKKCNNSSITIMERSLYSSRHVFTLQALCAGNIEPCMFDVCTEWFDHLTKTNDYKPDLIIYLRVAPEVALQRILKRNRTGESNITLDQLEKLHELHEEWLIHDPPPNQKIWTVDTDLDVDETITRYDELATDILKLQKITN